MIFSERFYQAESQSQEGDLYLGNQICRKKIARWNQDNQELV